MITLRLATLGAAAFLASMSMSYAGPCSGEIDRVQARVDAKLDALAATAAAERSPSLDSAAAIEPGVGCW